MKKMSIAISFLVLMILVLLDKVAFSSFINIDIPQGVTSSATLQANVPNSILTNSGTITVTGTGAEVSNGATIKNEGTIISNGDEIVTVTGANSQFQNLSSGVIDGTSGNKINQRRALYIKAGATGINRGTIMLAGNNAVLADGAGSTFYNYGKVSSNDQSIGSYNGALIRNYGTISSNVKSIMRASGSGSIIENENQGIINGPATEGMAASGGARAVNKGTIENDNSIGLLATLAGSVAENHGTIQNTGRNGILATFNGEAHNFGTISNKTRNGMAITSGSSGINEATGIIENDGGQGAIVSGTLTNGQHASFINKGTIRNSGVDGINVSDQGTITNEGTVANTEDNGITSYNSTVINRGMVANTGKTGIVLMDHSVATNEASGIIANLSSTGVLVNNNSTLTNEGEISNKGEVGVNLFGSQSSLINKGTIRNQGNIGVQITDTSTVTNESTGIIENTGDIGVKVLNLNSSLLNQGKIQNTKNIGIEVIQNSSAINDTTGEIKNAGDSGVYINGLISSFTNKGLIENGGDYGINLAVNGNVVNETTGEIKNHKDYGIYIYGNAVTLENKGSVANLGSYGIYSKGDNIIVNNTGTISNNSSYGVYVNGTLSTINNTGDIKNNNTIGVGLENNSILINDGNISNTNDYGVKLKNSSVTNKNTINNNGSYGIFAEKISKVNNESGAKIENSGDYGIFVQSNKTTAQNNGLIQNTGNYGAYITDNAIFTNNSGGIIANGKDYGIYAESTLFPIYNYGEIRNNGQYGLASGSHAKIYNDTNGIVKNLGGTGMLASGAESIATNSGIIQNTSSIGMLATSGGTIINSSTGRIKNSGDIGIKAENFNSSATNDNVIKNQGSYGMYASDQATIINSETGTIDNVGDYGMYATGSDTVALNNGNIINTGNYGVTVEAQAKFTNQKHGIIQNSGDYGINSTSEGALINNFGIIRNKGQYGIQSIKGSTINNMSNAIIENNGDNAIRIYDDSVVQNHTKAIIQNNGNYGINIKGDRSVVINSGTIENKKDYGVSVSGNSIFNNNGLIANLGDYGIYVTNGGSAINKGTVSITQKHVLYANGKNSTATNYGSLTTSLADGVLFSSFNGAHSYNYGDLSVGKQQIAVQVNGGDFYNSGTINATSGLYAIKFDALDNVLELGTGTVLRGSTDGDLGEDTLVISEINSSFTSGNGIIDVGNNSLHNFEKIVAASGNLSLQGTYNLNASNGSNYKSAAFVPASLRTYAITNANGANGNINLDGTINIDVDYSAMTPLGTNITGKVIANSFSLTTNSSINLTPSGNSTGDIISTMLAAHPNTKYFKISDLITIKSPVIVRPNFLTPTGNLQIAPQYQNNWQGISIIEPLGNKSTGISQIYFDNTVDLQNLPAPQPQPALPINVFIPRNRIDLDNMNRLRYATEDGLITESDYLRYKENKFTVDVNSTHKNKFKPILNDNFKYYSTDIEFTAKLLRKFTKRFTVGTGILYKYDNVTYDEVLLNNEFIAYDNDQNREFIKTLGLRLFSNYKLNNIDFVTGIAASKSDHKLKSLFSTGKDIGHYNSYVVSGSAKGYYRINLNKSIYIAPNLGLEYITLTEDKIRYQNSFTTTGTHRNSFLVEGGFYLSATKECVIYEDDKLQWGIGIGIKHRFKHKSFHAQRDIIGYENILKVTKLKYKQNTFMANLNINYYITKTFAINYAMKLENNNSINIQSITLGIEKKF